MIAELTLTTEMLVIVATSLVSAIVFMAGGYIFVMRTMNEERKKSQDLLIQAIRNLALCEKEKDSLQERVQELKKETRDFN